MVGFIAKAISARFATSTFFNTCSAISLQNAAQQIPAHAGYALLAIMANLVKQDTLFQMAIQLGLASVRDGDVALVEDLMQLGCNPVQQRDDVEWGAMVRDHDHRFCESRRRHTDGPASGCNAGRREIHRCRERCGAW